MSVPLLSVGTCVDCKARFVGLQDGRCYTCCTTHLRARVAELERKSEAVAEESKGLARELVDALAKLSLIESPAENVWRWMGDGEDHPETMSTELPVVMRVETLRKLIDRVAELEAERDRGVILLRGAMGAALRDALACVGCNGERCAACEPAQRWIDDAHAYLAATPKEPT